MNLTFSICHRLQDFNANIPPTQVALGIKANINRMTTLFIHAGIRHKANKLGTLLLRGLIGKMEEEQNNNNGIFPELYTCRVGPDIHYHNFTHSCQLFTSGRYKNMVSVYSIYKA